MAQHQPALQLAQFDQALEAARQAGLNASRLEIRPPVSDDRAWTVNEIDRRWPTQVDAVAIDGATMQVVDRTRFGRLSADGEAHPLGRRFFIWGSSLVWRISCCWWDLAARCALPSGWGTGYGGSAVRLRRPGIRRVRLLQAWLSLAWPARSLVLGLAFALGLAMPLMGASLLLFIAVDSPALARGNGAMRMMKSSD